MLSCSDPSFLKPYGFRPFHRRKAHSRTRNVPASSFETLPNRLDRRICDERTHHRKISADHFQDLWAMMSCHALPPAILTESP